MKIGIFGGTFDPPHIGHLSLAKAAMAQLELDEVILLPANRNPMKARSIQTPAKHRLAMVHELIKDEPNMSYSDMEITRGGSSYTVDTLGELQMVHPADYWFILGADSLRGISEWKNPVRLMKLCRLAVAVRPPFVLNDVTIKLTEDFRDRVDIVQMPPLDISSSELRSLIHRKQNVSPWLKPEVLQYIQKHKLYQNA